MRRVRTTPKPKSKIPKADQVWANNIQTPSSSLGRFRNKTGNSTKLNRRFVARANQPMAPPNRIRDPKDIRCSLVGLKFSKCAALGRSDRRLVRDIGSADADRNPVSFAMLPASRHRHASGL